MALESWKSKPSPELQLIQHLKESFLSHRGEHFKSLSSGLTVKTWNKTHRNVWNSPISPAANVESFNFRLKNV